MKNLKKKINNLSLDDDDNSCKHGLFQSNFNIYIYMFIKINQNIKKKKPKSLSIYLISFVQ